MLRRFSVLLLIAALLGGFSSAARSAEKSAEEKIAAEEARLGDGVKYLASDELEGRGVGTKGLDLAADYIAAEFAKAGLETKVFGDSPFQKFNMSTDSEMGPKEQNRLILQAGDKKTELELGKNFRPLALGSSGAFEAPLVFAGYGITSKEAEYDDYAGLDVKGKVLLILRKEPEQGNPHSKFEGNKPSQHATFTRKIANALDHEAAAIIFVNDRYSLEEQGKAIRKAWLDTVAAIAKAQEKYAKIEKPTDADFDALKKAVAEAEKKLAELGPKLGEAEDELLAFRGAGDGGNGKSLPVFFCTRAAIDPIVKAELGKDLAALEAEIDAGEKGPTPKSAALKNVKATGEANVIRKNAEVKNVVGVLEGQGSLADETVVVGAHYDHLGRGGAGSLAPWTVDIHNGADDNASGTTSLLEIARQCAERKKEGLPRRRIVFIAFTGEERGLIGSARYCREPRFALDKTVAMVNLDMVGRLKDEKLIVYGTGTAKELDALVDQFSPKYGFQISKKPEGYGPSDHSSFYAKKIPVLHLFTGTHSDYHRPSDDWDKINVPGMRRVAELSTDIVLSLAEAEHRPVYIEVKGGQPLAGDVKFPSFGSIPDYSFEGPGYRLSDVKPGGPAEKGGLKAGDIVLSFAGEKIAGVEGFMAALAKKKAGDKVEVKIKRVDEEKTLEVTLDSPR